MASLQKQFFLIVRTSTIAKNLHLNIVLQAELYLRTGTYDRPKNTLAVDSACAPLDSALAMRPAPLNRMECSVLEWIGDRYYCVGKSLLYPLPDGTSRMKRELISKMVNQKKKTRFAGLFFLTGLRPVLPLGQCPPSKPYTIAPTLQLLTISPAKPFLSNTT